ncbi:sarcosine oxidase subunit gamma [Roseospira marina]|uniref:Sarcosine oxidase subunit gamma n=1 Tax=Roseospira marina TaxID=140057 RepID=A0A5M6IHM5_9PROT|nr:sarcosine oxidase subunit gamma family protein [Roseospira marina]KAA5607447.1 sarcosine oxidase subunit gamma [Roseospira marina]MBB4312373.1 sarcosine oxidase subunit gamma [Roseospira marina]MBB5085611.1 sarcosine oxidase subunit gamma [Roseospira marina]
MASPQREPTGSYSEIDYGPGGPGGRWENPLYPLARAMAAASGPLVRLGTTPARSVQNLRATEGMLADIGTRLGVQPPTTPNTWTASPDGHRIAMWLGPDEWLLVGPDGTAPAVEATIRDARVNDPWLSVCDLSHMYTTLVLTGPRARLVLSKGCPLDLHPRVLGSGACVQTLLGRTRAVLRVTDGEGPNGQQGGADAIEIWVRNSIARYTAAWLIDAMTGIAHEPGDF